MPSLKLESSNVSDGINLEQKKTHSTVDHFITQATRREPLFLSSQTGESHVQWIQLLQDLDQQGSIKLAEDSSFEKLTEVSDETSLEKCSADSLSLKMNGHEEPSASLKNNEITENKTFIDYGQTIKHPEAAAAFSQAAMRASGEPDKYILGWPLLVPSKPQLQKCNKCSKEFCSPLNYRRHIRVHRRSYETEKDSGKTREHLGAFWDKISVEQRKEFVSFKNLVLEDVTGPSILRALSSLVRNSFFSSLPQDYVNAGAYLLDVIQARPSRLPISSKELFAILDDASERTFLLAGTAISVQKFIFDVEAGKIALETKNLIACTSFLVERNLVKAWVDVKDAEALVCHKMLVEEEEAAKRRKAQLQKRNRLKRLRQKRHKLKEQLSNSESVVELKLSSSDTTLDIASFMTTNPKATSDGDSDPHASSLENNQSTILDDTRLDNGSHLKTNGLQVMSAAIGDTFNGQELVANNERPFGEPRRLQTSLRNSGADNNKFTRVPVFRISIMKNRPTFQMVWAKKSKVENKDKKQNPSDNDDYRSEDNLHGSGDVLIGSISVGLVKHRNNMLMAQDCCKEAHSESETTVERHDALFSQVNLLNSEAGGTSVDDIVDTENLEAFTGFAAAEAFLRQRWKEAVSGEHFKLILHPSGEKMLDSLTDVIKRCRRSRHRRNYGRQNAQTTDNMVTAGSK